MSNLISLNHILAYFPELRLQTNLNLSREANGVPPDQILTSGVTHDSRKVRQGHIFLGLPSHSGSDQANAYVIDAISKGASIVILDAHRFCNFEHSKHRQAQAPRIFLTTPNCFKTLSDLSALFYPSHPRWLVAVTGTNGKTSTVNFVRQILGHLGHRVASLGTLGLQVENVPELDSRACEFESENTSMYAPVFHECVHTLAEEYAVEYLVFEASSHGLKEYRAHGVRERVQVAVFTNLTQDHLDYHLNMEDYFESKCRLFSDLLADGGVAFLNNRLTSEQMKVVHGICVEKQVKVWIYGQDSGDLYFTVSKTSAGIEVMFNLWGCEHSLTSDDLQKFPVFQLENLLVASGVVTALLPSSPSLLEMDKLVRELPTFIKCVPGRMEFIGNSLPSHGKIFVDYAHTPDALEIVLRDCRASQDAGQSRLILVFGCGGNRDEIKRYKMGRVAAIYASHIIVTDDNPRNEDPARIRSQILEGVSEILADPQMRTRAKIEIHEIGDRKSAIRFGIDCLQSPADICVIAGKGAEAYQIIGNVRYEFSDEQVVLGLLQE